MLLTTAALLALLAGGIGYHGGQYLEDYFQDPSNNPFSAENRAKVAYAANAQANSARKSMVNLSNLNDLSKSEQDEVAKTVTEGIASPITRPITGAYEMATTGQMSPIEMPGTENLSPSTEDLQKGKALNSPFWKSLTDAEREAILDEYYDGDYSLLLNDLNELDSFSDAYPIYSDYLDPDAIWGTATSEVEAENAALLELLSSDKATALDLLGSTRDDTLQLLADTRDTALADIASESAANRAMLNSQLQRMGASFDNARDAILTAQYQRNAQTMGTLAADMQSSRRNAIEAGASAGIRIAGNVNALLSAQNKMAQQSLDTSNQLAQMLVNQRNAEAGVAGQWMQGEASRGQQRRAADSAYTSGVAGANNAYNTGVLGANSAYTSGYNNITSNTFNNITNRANAYTTKAQNKYDVATGSWSDKFDSSISATNPLRGHYETYLKKPKY